ncbi:hypothetical protein ACSQ67_020679 [Phaseolus vulgaris]
MASTFLTLPTPFLHKTNAISFSNKRPSFSQWSSLKINAIANKWEPTKVVPEADVLIRMEELSDKTAGGVLLSRSAVKFERYLVGEAGELKAGTKGMASSESCDVSLPGDNHPYWLANVGLQEYNGFEDEKRKQKILLQQFYGSPTGKTSLQN